MIIQLIGAFIATVAFSVVVDAPKKYLCMTGLVGMAGWFVYLLADMRFSVVIASFLATLIIALMSHIFARIFKAPVTVFLITGILPIVPGAGMYKIAYNVLVNDTAMMNTYFRQTILAAGGIAFAIFIVDSLFKMAKKRKQIRRELR